MTNPVSSALAGAGTGAAMGSVVPGWGTLIGGVLGAGSGLLGYFLSEQGAEDAQKTLKQAQDKYGEITSATIRRAMADVLGPTKLAEIQADPGYQQMQDSALAELKRVSDSGGMTLEDRAQFNEALAKSGQQQAQLRQAALEGLRSRGLSGAGAETQMQIAGQQAAANVAGQAGTRALADSQRRALEAIAQRGQLAGQMQQTKYQRAADVARAQDVINQLNWGNRQKGYAAMQDMYGRQLGFGEQQAGMQATAGERAGRMGENVLASAGQFATGYDAERMRAEEKAADRAAAARGGAVTPSPLSAPSYGSLGSDPFGVGQLQWGNQPSDDNKDGQ